MVQGVLSRAAETSVMLEQRSVYMLSKDKRNGGATRSCFQR